MQYVVGLTGLIGSGKTVVGKIFTDLGIDVIDTDTIAREITQKDGAAINAIIHNFGAEFITPLGALDRKKMRENIFAVPELRYKLEQVLHPLILLEVLDQIRNNTGDNYIIVIVPLLFKSLKYLSLICRSIFVDCKEAVLISRVKERSGLTTAEVKDILKTQTPRSLQLSLSDDVLHNNGSIFELTSQVTQLNYVYNKLFGK